MSRPDSLCIGALHWDVIGHAPDLVPGGDEPGHVVQRPGGVAFNIARALAGHGLRPALLTATGDDPASEALLAAALTLGADTAHAIRMAGLGVDRYVGIETRDGLLGAVADARTLESAGAAILAPLEDGRLASFDRPWLGPAVVDTNLAPGVLARVIAHPALRLAEIILAPAGPGKAERLRPLLPHPGLVLYLNRAEAERLCARTLAGAAEAAEAVLALGAGRVVVTDGPRDVAEAAADGILTARPPLVQAVRVTGAGDIFLATHLAARHGGADRSAALSAALAAAARHVSGEIP